MGDATTDRGGADPACRECGGSVGEAGDRRVLPRVEDGNAVHLHFCSATCLETWRSRTGDD